MRSVKDIAWTAGFLEGEGWFGYRTSPTITVAQVQREPLERLFRWFGGNLRVQRKPRTGREKDIWWWEVSGSMAAQLMMTLLVLMSPKRQARIVQILEEWKTKAPRRPKGSMICSHGHDMRIVGKLADGHCGECNRQKSRRRWAVTKAARAAA